MSSAPAAGAPHPLAERAEARVVLDLDADGRAPRTSRPPPARRPSPAGSSSRRARPVGRWTGPGRPIPTPAISALRAPGLVEHLVDEPRRERDRLRGGQVGVERARGARPAPRARGRRPRRAGGACRSPARARRRPRGRARRAPAGGPIAPGRAARPSPGARRRAGRPAARRSPRRRSTGRAPSGARAPRARSGPAAASTPNTRARAVSRVVGSVAHGLDTVTYFEIAQRPASLVRTDTGRRRGYEMGRFRLRMRSGGLALLAVAAVVSVPAVSGAHKSSQPQVGKPRMEHGCARIEDRLPTLSDWPRVDSRIKDSKKLEARVQSMLARADARGEGRPDDAAGDLGDHARPRSASTTSARCSTAAARGPARTSTPRRRTGWRSPTPTGPPPSRATPPASPRSGASTPSTATRTSSARRCSRTTSGSAPRTTRAWSATSRPRPREQVRATGQDWAFAPTLAVVRDDRWGRTYEGFSEDPRITRAYGYEAMRGLQGHSRHGIGSDGVIGTAKHFIGDGGTAGGKDQGVNPSSEAEMINIHGQGYYGALAAGSQTVMVSFNSWTNEELGHHRGQAARQRQGAQRRSSRARWASTASSSPTGTASARSRAAPTRAARRRSTPASTW